MLLQQLKNEKQNQSMKDYINTVQVGLLVHHAKNDSQYEGIFRLANEKYHLGLGKLGPEDILQIALRINERENDKRVQSLERKSSKKLKSDSWVFGELKVFCWVSVYYCHSKSISLSNWGQFEFAQMQNIFRKKSIDFISYQAVNLLYSKTKLKEEWTDEQINYLKEIINETNVKIQWRYISFKIYCLSNHKYFRPLQQCREKWMNYLNPKVRKGEWSLEEDLKLFTLIESVGCKWALISRQLKGERTEHMVKNRYNSYMKSWKIKCNIKSHLQLSFKILFYLKNKLKREETQKTYQKQEEEIEMQKVFIQSIMLQNEKNKQITYPVCNQQILSNYQCNQFIEKLISKVQADYDKEDKRTKDEEDEQDMKHHLFLSNIEKQNNDEIQEQQIQRIDDDVQSSINEAKKENGSITVSDVDKLLVALGCHHYEQIIDDNWLDQLEEKNNLQWIQ